MYLFSWNIFRASKMKRKKKGGHFLVDRGKKEQDMYIPKRRSKVFVQKQRHSVGIVYKLVGR